MIKDWVNVTHDVEMGTWEVSVAYKPGTAVACNDLTAAMCKAADYMLSFGIKDIKRWKQVLKEVDEFDEEG